MPIIEDADLTAKYSVVIFFYYQDLTLMISEMCRSLNEILFSYPGLGLKNEPKHCCLAGNYIIYPQKWSEQLLHDFLFPWAQTETVNVESDVNLLRPIVADWYSSVQTKTDPTILGLLKYKAKDHRMHSLYIERPF